MVSMERDNKSKIGFIDYADNKSLNDFLADA
jgi:hypothetical protein